MACGEISPLSKTLAPSRVTSRSSCNTLSLCCTTRAIFNRQEFDPISIAAYVCISWRVPLDFSLGYIALRLTIHDHLVRKMKATRREHSSLPEILGRVP